MRVENLRLSLLRTVEVRKKPDQIVIQNGDQRLSLPQWTDYLLSKLDGSVFLSDTLRTMKSSPGQSLRLREIIEVIKSLAQKNFLENSKLILDLIEPLLTRSSTPSVVVPVLTDNQSQPGPVKFDQQRLLYYLRKTPLRGSSTQDPYLKKILKHSEVLSYPAGAKIIAYQSEARELYVLLEGRAGVYVPGAKGPLFLALLQPVTVFGESAAVLGKKRTADVTALDDCQLLRVDLHKVLETKEDTALTDFSSLKTRLLLHQLLFSSSLFSGLPSEVFQLVLEKSSKLEVSTNESVIEEGENEKSFYLILKGTLGVYRDGERVASLSRGDHFGEIATLFNRPRTATLKAFSPSILLRISQKDMVDLVCEHLSLGLHLEDVALARLQQPRTQRATPAPDISLTNIDDLSNPFGNVPEDSIFQDLPIKSSEPLEMDELELDFNFDFTSRE
jgi:CRP-like cAMP-binding protein